MQIEVSRRDPVAVERDALVLLIPSGDRLPRPLRALDRALGGRIGALLASGDFRGKTDELMQVPADGIAARRVLLAGLGEEAKLSTEALRRATAAALKTLVQRRGTSAALLVPVSRRVPAAAAGEAIAVGAVLGTYRFDKYRTVEEAPPETQKLELLSPGDSRVAAVRQGVRFGQIAAEATGYARDLSNEPGSVHTPVWLAEQARRLGRETGLRVRVLAERELAREKLGGLLAVGRGSVNPPRLIVFEHQPPARGRQRSRPTIVLIGKGITFDSGGVSLKPGANMDEMKHDMSGGAAVFGAMRAIAGLRLPLHVVGIVPAAQNMPDGRAYLPGDVIHTAAGKTVEVLNTDAEGRIVLADALHYAARYEPAAIIDLATLTGACVIALGSHCAGMMGNDERLQRRIQAAGEHTHERAWPLPLWDEHRKQIESRIADIKNIGGREAGPLTAGAFLSHFVDGTPWAHLDIAGTAWTSQDKAYCVKGATGFGVYLLAELLRSWR
jgi:leucyl aminopeptidase